MAVESLSSRLSQKLSSTDQFLSLLAPVLSDLQLLPPSNELLKRHGKAPLVQEVAEDIQSVEERRGAFLHRQLGLVQKVVLEQVWVEWESALVDGGVDLMVLERLFVPPPPDSDFGNPEIYSKVAITSYSVMVSLLSPSRRKAPLHRRTLEIISSLLVELSKEYSISTLFQSTFTSESLKDERKRNKATSAWELIVKDIVGVPTRVANAWGEQASSSGALLSSIPEELTTDAWFATLSTSYEQLLWDLSQSANTLPSQSLSYTLSALSSFLPPRLHSPSFFPSILPSLVRHILPIPFPAPAEASLRRARYAQSWRSVADDLAPRDASKLVVGLIAALEGLLERSIDDEDPKGRRGAVFLLKELLGSLDSQSEDDSVGFEVALPVVLDHSRNWSEGIARVVVDWVSEDGQGSKKTEQAKVALLERVMETWSAKESIKDATDSRRTYLTILLLHSVYSLPPLHPAIIKLSRSPAFLNSVSSHLSLMRPTVRLLGMLVAEIVSSRSIKAGEGAPKLSFGEVWEGEEPEKVLCRRIRENLEKNADLEGRKVEGWQEVLTGAWGMKPTTIKTPVVQPPRAIINSKPSSSQVPAKATVAPATKRPLISVMGDYEDEDDFPTMNLPPEPSSSYLDTLNSDDPSLYATALPTGKSSTTRQRGKLRAPVYIPELTAYLRGKDPDVADSKEDAEQEAERVEKGLAEAEALIRRKTGWGGELEENAVDLAIVLVGLQDQFELEKFDELKQAALAALVRAVPSKVGPTIIEQYFTSNYSIQQRHIMLTALALGARELAGLPLPKFLPSNASTSLQQIDNFPSKRLPPALHRRLVGSQEAAAPSNDTLPRGALEQITEDLTRSALSDAKEDAETTIPEAAREKLLSVNVRRFASAPAPKTTQATSTSPTFSTVAAEHFIMPLINNFWLYLRDSAPARGAQARGPYAGGANSSSLLEPVVLSRYLSTLAVLLHASRHAPHFLALLVPEAMQLVLALRVPQEESDKAVLEAQMELLLTALDATVALDNGASLMRSVEGGSNLVGEVKEWAESVFVVEEKRGGDNGIGRAGRAAAGVLLRVEEILDKWRGKVGW